MLHKNEALSATLLDCFIRPKQAFDRAMGSRNGDTCPTPQAFE